MEENRIPKRVLYMNLGTTRLRGRPRNRWQDDVREDGWIVGGKGWKERERLLRTARNRHILHMPTEWMNEWSYKEYQNLKSWETVSCKNSVFKITHRPHYRFKRNSEFSTNLWNTESENLFWMWHQILKSVLPGSTFSRRFPPTFWRRFPISWTLTSRLRCSENIHQWPVSTEFNRDLQKREEMCKSIYTALITKIRKINKIYARSQSRNLIKILLHTQNIFIHLK